MARPRTKGDMCDIYTGTESEYGTAVPTTAHGRLKTLSDKTSDESEKYVLCGSRVSASGQIIRTTGYSANMTLRSGDLAAWLALGYTTEAELPSYTTEVKVGPQEWHLWKGCVVNTMTLSASQIGSAVTLTTEAVAQWHTSKDETDGYSDEKAQTITLANPTAGGATKPVAYTSFPTVTDVSGTETVPAKSWSLSINNALTSLPSSGIYIAMAAGQGAYPTDLDITFSMTITSQIGRKFDRYRENAQTVTVKVSVDGKTLTVKGVVDSAGPDRNSESGYDETITLKNCTLTVE